MASGDATIAVVLAASTARDATAAAPAPRRGASPSLRVGLDGHAFSSPAGGVRRYVHELCRAIPAVDPTLELIAIGAPPDIVLPRGLVRAGVRCRVPTNLGWTQVNLPVACRRARLDLFHGPAYTGPLWGVGPLVLTIHDVSYARRPEWYPYRRDRVRLAFYRQSARAADLVITDSNFSRNEIVAAYGIDAARIVVIPLGVGAPFTTTPGANGPIALAEHRAHAPYILHVGDLHVRRNLEVALHAVVQTRARRPELCALQLVLAGIDRGVGGRLRQLSEDAGHPDALRFEPVVDDDRLVQLYRAARALIYPSRYEGFGLPVLEAMACGLPVVAARAGSLPEVVGDAGLLVEPDDVGGFADAVEAVLLDRPLAARLADASTRRAATLTWERTAMSTAAAYRRCVSEARDR